MAISASRRIQLVLVSFGHCKNCRSTFPKSCSFFIVFLGTPVIKKTILIVTPDRKTS